MQKRPKITLIAAVARHGVIGCENKMPWHLPEDLQHFKRYTLGKPILMGRKTWDSLGRPLPQRRNMVLTRQASWWADGAECYATVDDALVAVAAEAELCVIGGEEIYRLMLSYANGLWLTEIDADFVGDAYFPEFSRELWHESSRESHFNMRDQWKYDFVYYQRVKE